MQTREKKPFPFPPLAASGPKDFDIFMGAGG